MALLARPEGLTPVEMEKLDSVFKAPGLKATLISVFCAFGGWALLLPVVPLAVIDAGGSDSLAGLSTGLFMVATVITQAFTPAILRRVGHMPIMAVASLLLGAPAAIYAFDMSPATVLGVAIIRGIGFGAVTVAEAALIAELVPPRLVGRSSGVFGATVGVTQLAAFPLGMWLYSHFGELVFLLALVYSIVGALAAIGLPVMRRHADHDVESESLDYTPPEPRAATWKLATVPGFCIAVAAGGFAAFSTFMAPAVGDIDPAAAATIAGLTLSVMGGMQIVTRLGAGWWADRVGEPGHLMVSGLVLSLLGLLLAGFAIAWELTGWKILVAALGAAALFGAGFGVAQTEALLMMFHRLPREKSAQASALWNMTFDSGTGLGATLLGVVAGALAYQGAFFVAGAIVVVGIFVAILDRIIGRHRVTDHGNVRERLRRVVRRSVS
ncbi:MFS transporter [uncultured Corynebacterium sp.]|uniref:MFS transporter n=1 Tax=uncultured Corynebacterium sp. TaxID=159447 RepID=UPI0025E1BE57|nr:MFS transporter [uncultured Corynebacterium sp.]